MKRIYIILLAIAGVIAIGLLIWQKKHSCFNMKMSMICEQSCAADNADASKAVAQSVAMPGDLTICPVSGVAFTVGNENEKVKSGDKTAYTRCGTCAELYQDAPEDYAANIH